MKQGNVQNKLATDGQFNEVQLSVTRAVNKLRSRLTFDAAQALNGDSKIIDKCLEQLLLVCGDASRNELSITQGKDLLIGTLSCGDLISAVLSTGSTDDIITDMIKRISVADQSEVVRLIELSPREFGLSEKPLRTDFINEEFLLNWSKMNLGGHTISACSSEDPLQFFIQSNNLSNNELFVSG